MTNHQPPNLPAMIVQKGSRGAYYVYSYKNEWDAEKKRSKRTNSKLIGKIIGGGKEGVVEFTPGFIEQYPALEFLVTTKIGSSYKFTPIDSKEYIQKKHSLPIAVKHAGATWALDNIVASSPILEALKLTFLAHNDYLKILSLAYFIVLNRSNSLSGYRSFAESTLLPYGKTIDKYAFTRLCQSFKQDHINNFLATMNRLYCDNYSKDQEGNILIALDSTSASTYIDQLSLAQYGYNKDLANLKHENVLILIDKHHGLPLFYGTYEGQVPKASTLREAIEQYTDIYQKQNIVLVSDRTKSLTESINDCLSCGMGFIFNSNIDDSDTFIKGQVDKHKDLLLDPLTYSDVGNTVTAEILWPKALGTTDLKHNQASSKLNLHIFYHKEIYDKYYGAVLEKTFKAIKALKAADGYANAVDPVLIERIKTYTDYDYDQEKDRYLNCIMSQTKIDEKLKYVGIRVLISDQTKLSAIDCHQTYYERCRVEYDFNTSNYRLAYSQYNGIKTDLLIFIQLIASSISLQVRLRLLKNKNQMMDKNLKNKVLYESDNYILAALNNIFAKLYEHTLIYDDVVEPNADFYRAMGVPIPSSNDAPIFANAYDENAEAKDNCFDDPLFNLEEDPI